MAILARKSGWLISCEILKKMENSTKVRTRDTKVTILVKNSDTGQKLFDGDGAVEAAEHWINGTQPTTKNEATE